MLEVLMTLAEKDRVSLIHTNIYDYKDLSSTLMRILPEIQAIDSPTIITTIPEWTESIRERLKNTNLS
jgi:hypothetical protein